MTNKNDSCVYDIKQLLLVMRSAEDQFELNDGCFKNAKVGDAVVWIEMCTVGEIVGIDKDPDNSYPIEVAFNHEPDLEIDSKNFMFTLDGEYFYNSRRTLFYFNENTGISIKKAFFDTACNVFNMNDECYILGIDGVYHKRSFLYFISDGDNSNIWIKEKSNSTTATAVHVIYQ